MKKRNKSKKLTNLVCRQSWSALVLFKTTYPPFSDLVR